MITDIDEQTVQEQYCECCDGNPGGYCTNDCDGFKIAYLICELGLDEDWDWVTPKNERELLAALRLVKKTLIKDEPTRTIGGSSEPQKDKSDLLPPEKEK